MTTPVGPHLDHVHAAAQRHADARGRHRRHHDEAAAAAYQQAQSQTPPAPPADGRTQ